MITCSTGGLTYQVNHAGLSPPFIAQLTLIPPNSGPASSPYEGGTFIVDFIFPADYPFKCPEIKFLTKIYHPNIKTDTGEICADIINSNWAPTLDVYHCLETLQSMLLNPSADSPVEAQIATQLRDDYDAFAATAKKWTAEHAS